MDKDLEEDVNQHRWESVEFESIEAQNIKKAVECMTAPIKGNPTIFYNGTEDEALEWAKKVIKQHEKNRREA